MRFDIVNGMISKVRGFVLIFSLGAVAYFGGLFVLPPVLLFLLFPQGLFLTTEVNNFSCSSFFLLVPGILEVIFGVRVKICGDLKKLEGPCLIIMNHRTRLDWMFLWCYLLRMGNLQKLKIMLQKPLKKVPVVGWAMQALMFIFISRKWSTDEEAIKKKISYFTTTEFPIQLLIFPEGTDLSPNNKAKSHCYADKNGLQKYDYVLHPKKKGFCLCVDELSKGKVPLTIVNMSVGYIGTIAQNERDVCLGNWPTEIHFFAEQIPLAQLHSDKEELSKWLVQCWEKKEEQLREFYVNKKFSANYLSKAQNKESLSLAIQSMVIWCIFFVFLGYNLMTSSFYWIYFAILTIIYLMVNQFTDGMDSLMLKRHYLFLQSTD